MTTNNFLSLKAASVLRARWIADPLDLSGDRMIAVWERVAAEPPRVGLPAGRRPGPSLPSKSAVLASLTARIPELTTIS